VRIYEDDGRYEEMLERWKANQTSYQSTAALIKQLAPNCPDLLALMNNHRSRFLDFRRSFVKQITLLKRDIELALEEGMTSELIRICDRFDATMSRSATMMKVDISPLRKDATLYTAVTKAIEDRDVYPLLGVSETSFTTPPFKKVVPAVIQKIPPKTVLDTFSNARTAWRKGQGTEAVRMLSVESAGDWTSAAASLKKGYEAKLKTIAKFEALTSPIAEKDWPFVVKSIRDELSGPDDAMYREKYEPAFTQALNSARLQAVAAYDHAGTYWKAYQDAGPIDQTHRSSTKVTVDYVALAKSLKGAVESIVRWKRFADLIAEPIDAERLKFWEQIMKECRYQWGRMSKSRFMISKATLEEKIKHLPEPPTEWK
jgi:hypothetical protein